MVLTMHYILFLVAGACAFSPCLNGVCTPEGLTSFTCECAAGYTGTMCDIDINDCDPNPCQNEGTCTDGVASFICDCVTGYTGNTCDVEGMYIWGLYYTIGNSMI